MNKIKEIKLDKTNWLEVTWVKVETITLPQEVVEGVADAVLRTQEVETAIHCESFGDSDEYQELLKQRCIEFGTEITEELEDTLLEQISKRYIPTDEEEAEAARRLMEQQQSQFRAERNTLLQQADIEINKLEDNNQDSTAWRAYRQALRDSTETWQLPTKPEGAK